MNEIYRRLTDDLDGEANRLMRLVDELSEKLAIAEAEHRLVEDWTDSRLNLIRSALRNPDFADVGATTALVERAEAELSAVQELRRRLAGEHT